MPDLNFKNPQGQSLTVNSPDGSMPSEYELDSMFAQKYGNVVQENPGSHPTYGAPEFNQNPFLAFGKGVYEGGSKLAKTVDNLRMKAPGQEPLGPTVPNPMFNMFREAKSSMPGTVAGVSQDIGKGLVESAPTIAAGSFGPLGMGAVGAVQAYGNNEDPAHAFLQNALLGKAWQVAGGLGSKAFIETASKLGIPADVASREFLKRAGSSVGAGLTSAATSGGNPSDIATGAAFGAFNPSEPFKKTDIIPEKIGNPLAYSMMKGYMLPWAKDFKYNHDPVKGWLDEGLTANNIDDAAQQAAQRKTEIGQQIKQSYTNSSQSGQTSDYSKALDPLQAKIAELNKNPKSNASTIQRLQNAHDDLSATLQKNPNMTPSEAFDFKDQINQLTKWTGNPGDDKPINAALQDSYRNVRDTLNNQVPELKDFNERYGNLTEATKRLQYRADASNPLLNFGKGAWDLGWAALLGHGNPVATAALMGLETAGRSGAVKTRLAKALYSRPDFADVPEAGAKSPALGLPFSPAEKPQYIQDRENAPIDSLGVKGENPYISGKAPIWAWNPILKLAYDKNPQGRDIIDVPVIKADSNKQMTPVPNESGIDQFSTPKEGEVIEQNGPSAHMQSPSFAKGGDTKGDITPEIKEQAKKATNEYWMNNIMGPFNPLNPKNTKNLAAPAALLAGGLAFGSGQAQAQQNSKYPSLEQAEGGRQMSGDTIISNGGIQQPVLSDFNKSTNKNYTMEDLDDVKKRDEVRDFYFKDQNYNKLPTKTQQVMQDYGYHFGINKANKDLQGILSVKQDGIIGKQTLGALNKLDDSEVAQQLIDKQKEYIKTRSNYKENKKGWENRINAVQSLISK